MRLWLLALAAVIQVVQGKPTYLQLTDEQYYTMPQLFTLDNYEKCLAVPRALYCLGSLVLQPPSEGQPSAGLYTRIQEFSKNPENFNHTIVHRGLCVSARCPEVAAASDSPASAFEHCADRSVWLRHELHVTLHQLAYCRRAEQRRPIDVYDLAFLCLVAIIALLNILGTTYDVLWKSDDQKGNPYLIAWSIRANWQRLTAHQLGTDQRLNRLSAIQGIRVFMMIVVISAHAVLLPYTSYVENPRFIELGSQDPGFVFMFNGSMVVQWFFVISSFLLAYNLLIYFETHPKFDIFIIPRAIINRIVRISPTYWFVWAYAATWAAHASDGPLWTPLMQAEADVCRRKWWTHLLYVNNLVDPDNKCLTQTWFLAADMQLYLVSLGVMLVLWRWPRAARVLLPVLLLGSVALLFALAYALELKPALFLQKPEYMRTMYHGSRSFNVLYQNPVGSLPSTTVGLALAYLHYHLQRKNIDLRQNKVVSLVCAWGVPLGFGWVLLGNALQQLSSRLAVSAYAAAERPVFALIAALVMYSAFNRVDDWMRRLLEWRGFTTLGRLTLSALMLHWTFNRSLLAARLAPSQMSIHLELAEAAQSVALTYLAACPLSLLLELPCTRLLKALTTPRPAPHTPAS